MSPKVQPKFSIPSSNIFNVFDVTQIAPGTFLEDLMGFDFIKIEAGQTSEIHRHNYSDNIIYVLSGSAILILDGSEFHISRGTRVFIPRGTLHGFRTPSEPLEFVSAQVPTILDKRTGKFDREIIG